MAKHPGNDTSPSGTNTNMNTTVAATKQDDNNTPSKSNSSDIPTTSSKDIDKASDLKSSKTGNRSASSTSLSALLASKGVTSFAQDVTHNIETLDIMVPLTPNNTNVANTKSDVVGAHGTVYNSSSPVPERSPPFALPSAPDKPSRIKSLPSLPANLRPSPLANDILLHTHYSTGSPIPASPSLGLRGNEVSSGHLVQSGVSWMLRNVLQKMHENQEELHHRWEELEKWELEEEQEEEGEEIEQVQVDGNASANGNSTPARISGGNRGQARQRRVQIKENIKKRRAKPFAYSLSSLDRQGSAARRFYHPTVGLPRWILQWPILFSIAGWVLFLMWTYIWIRFFVALYELVTFLLMGKKRRLLLELRSASSYQEYVTIAKKLDALEKYDVWKKINESPYYDSDTIYSLIEKLERGTEIRDSNLLLDTLSSIYNKNLGGLGLDSVGLYSETYFGTKKLVDRLVQNVIASTLLLYEAPEHVMSLRDKLKFFRKAKQAYGNTALCLSSGGMLALYSLGVVKALYDEHLLPRIFSGSSAGAMVASLVCTRTDEELQDFFHPSLCRFITPCDEPWLTLLWRYLVTGAIFSPSRFGQTASAMTFGNMTFIEAYDKTGRILNITVSSTLRHGAPVMLNHITTPHVCIWSAVVASSAMPGLLPPVELYQKKPGVDHISVFNDFGKVFCDGVLRNDIPKEELSHFFNVNFFVVSQMNPHVIPFLFESKGSSGDPRLRRQGNSSGLRGGFMLSTLEALLRLEMRKWLVLIEEMDLLPQIKNLDFSKFLLQTFTGDVTIYPKGRGLGIMMDYMRLVTNPTYGWMQQYLIGGSQFTWPKLAQIHNHYILERILVDCEEELTMRLYTSQES